MRRTAIGATAIMVAVGLLSPTQASAADTVNSKKLRDAVTVADILGHERALQRIADQNDGSRASGTPGFDASGAYVMAKLRKAGYKVKKQKFDFGFFQELAPSKLSQVAPTAKDITSDTMDYSGTGEVTGTIVPTKDVQVPAGPTPSSSSSGCEAGDFAPAPAAGPAIALLQRGTCDFVVKVNNAVAAGYDGAIIFNEGQPGRADLLMGTLGTPVSVPVVGVSYADGADLYQASKAGGVTVSITTSTFSEIRPTFNVIADSKKKAKHPDQVVVVGAHLDSVAAGPGINDNGSGTATILEIAEQMAELKYTKKLQRPVRFAFWGAEEAGLVGSTYYVNDLVEHHPRQLEKIYANLNFDMLGSPNYVRFVYDGDGSDTGTAGPIGSAEIEGVFNDYFASQNLATAPTAFDGRSDYGPFIDQNIPAGGLFSGAENVKTAEQAALFGGTAGQPYDACYHKACDDLSNLSTKALAELGDAAAHATYALTMSKAGLYPDGSGAKAPVKRAAQKSETIASR